MADPIINWAAATVEHCEAWCKENEYDFFLNPVNSHQWNASVCEGISVVAYARATRLTAARAACAAAEILVRSGE